MAKKNLSSILILSLLLFLSPRIFSQNVSINTTGAINSTSSMLEVLQPSATNNTVGIFARHNGAATNAYAIWAEATSGTNNYAFVVPASKGFVGIGTSTPTTLFHVDGGAGATTQTIATISGNSLTTGKGLSILSSSLTSGNLLNVQATNAAGTGNAIYVSNNSTGTGNCITAVQSGLSSTGNAIDVSNFGSPGYSALFSHSTAQVAGSGYGSNTSNHAIYGSETCTNLDYSFGVYGSLGYVGTPGLRCGGVIGTNGNSTGWGALGYRSSAPAWYGEYISSNATYGNGGWVNGGGRLNGNVVDTTSGGIMVDDNMPFGIGMGIQANLWGGWVRGGIFGMNIKGDRYSIYSDGKTFTNDITVQLSKSNGSDERTATYVPTSTSVDVYSRGSGKLENGKATITFDRKYTEQLSPNEKIMVTVTPIGPSNGVYVNETSPGGFLVIENNKGTSNVEFYWMAVGVRKGYEKPELPKELLSGNYDEKMNGVMHNEDDPKTSATPMWWDGKQLQFNSLPPKPGNKK
ncbi:MAG TPA: hypothetical protein VII99_15260 [Bacteroidia bacterium]